MNKKLERIPREGAIAGVCAGVAIYNGWDKSWVRTLWVVATFVTSMLGLFFIAPLVYVILWITLPVRNDFFGFQENKNDPFQKATWQTQQPGYAPWTAPVEEPTFSQPQDEPQAKPFTAYEPYTPPVPPVPPTPPKKGSGRTIAGIILLIMGSVLLIHQLDWIQWDDIRQYYPGILCVIGLYLIGTSFSKPAQEFVHTNAWEDLKEEEHQTEKTQE